MEYRADIDGLRAIAILLVVAFHVGVPGFEGGFIGVDVFFVISGYLISGLLWSEVKISGRINWFDFYARRIRRLLPALILTLIAVLIAGSFLMVPDPELRWLAQSVIATGTFSSNFFFFLKTRGYFGAESDLLPLLNTWSLAVEEQFYVVWPVILSVAGWCLSRFIKRGRFIALSLVTCITLASFVFCHWLLARNPSAAFYFMPSRLWELGLGGLLAIGGGTNSIIGPRMRLFLGVVGTGAVLGSVVLIRSSADIPGSARFQQSSERCC